MERPIHWHIIGAGAMGCLWAAYLWKSPTEITAGNVTLLLRNDDELARYNNLGGILLTKGARSNRHAIPAHSLHNLFEPVTHLLIATKAHDVETALASIQHLLGPTTCIVLLQNGLKVQKEVTARDTTGNIYCASTSLGAYLQQPFHVIHAGTGDTWLGQIGAQQHRSLMHALPVSALSIQWDNDIESRLWEKLAINCAINALTVIHDCRNGELLTIPAAVQDLLALTQEIENLYRLLEQAPALPHLHERVQSVLQDTALNISSTLQDARLGRRTEIAHLNGYLCDLAQEKHLPCPINKAILERFTLSIHTLLSRQNGGLKCPV